MVSKLGLNESFLSAVTVQVTIKDVSFLNIDFLLIDGSVYPYNWDFGKGRLGSCSAISNVNAKVVSQIVNFQMVSLLNIHSVHQYHCYICNCIVSKQLTLTRSLTHSGRFRIRFSVSQCKQTLRWEQLLKLGEMSRRPNRPQFFCCKVSLKKFRGSELLVTSNTVSWVFWWTVVVPS